MGSISSKTTLTKGEKEGRPREKERARRKKEEKGKKEWLHSVSFIMATCIGVYGRKKLLDGKKVNLAVKGFF